ncbi:MAG: RIP metalloprotease RseP [Candidatus Omnitrophica bacterium]|nr:RIP metalloprotease RseP [Candidatus Omnitrophota bacterium]MDD5351864.1 RIP metalloprotease RseP [Candidatus Omnitrophota bacterium]MDD5550690.1 RIP metalloprotease RseP [Candidatus Omnitrophota bacterium]
MNTIIFLIIISVLIFVHEFGHLFMARRLGIKVEKFSLGFGTQLFGFKFKDIDFKICLIPFGGYVKLAGDSRQEYKGNHWEYFSRKPIERAKIVFFGPLFNYILAFLLLWAVYCIGYPQMNTTIGQVLDNMPAKSSGILEKDRIISVDGKKVNYWSDVLVNIKERAIKDKVEVKVLRNNQEISFSIAPQEKEEKDLFGKTRKVTFIGIAPSGEIVEERYNIFAAFFVSLFRILQLTYFTFKAIISLILGHLSLKEAVTGPVGIFNITSEAAKYGFNALLHVTSMFSLALAIFNVLPIPVLDGGHLLFLGIENLRKKPLSDKVEQRITDVGFGFILILAVFILFNDLIRYGYWDKLNGYLIKWHTK